MDFVCKVTGELVIADLNLNLVHMEIIDLYPDDFKVSPRLREAQRNKEIEVYSSQHHRTARRLKKRNTEQNKIQIIKENSSEFSLKEPLVSINNKLDYLMSRIEIIISKNKNEPELKNLPNLKEDILNKILSQNQKIEEYINSTKSLDEGKLNDILNKFENLLEKRLSINKEYLGKTDKKEMEKEDIPIYIPKLDDIDIIEKNIKSQEIVSEGTDNILEKLKKLKGNL